MKLAKVNTAKVEGGAWVGDIPDMGDLRLRVRGINNARYRRLQQELINAVPRSERRKGRLDPEAIDNVTATCLLRTVLLGWENLECEDGRPVPFSEEQAKVYLTDPAYRAFYDAVVYAATIVGEDDAEADKADEGNSASASAGP